MQTNRIPTDTKPSAGINQIATSLLMARSAKGKGDDLAQKHQIEAAQNAFDKEILSRREAWSKQRQKLQKDLADTASQLSASEDQSELIELYEGYVAEGNTDAATAIAAVIKSANPQIVLEASEREMIAGSPDAEALKRGKFGAKLTPFEKARQAGLTEDQQKRAAEVEAGITGSFAEQTDRQETDIASREAETKQYQAETERIKAEELPEKQQLSEYILDNAEALGLTAEAAGVVAQQVLGAEETTEQLVDTLYEKIDSLNLDAAESLKRKADITSAIGGVKMGETGKKTDFATTQDILDSYADDTANNRAFNQIANMIPSKDARQSFAASANRYAKGKGFKELSEPENAEDKEGLGRLMVQEMMENAAGGEIVKRHLRTQELLRVHLPEIMKTIDDMRARGIDLGRFTAVTERAGQFFVGNTDNPEVAKINTRIKDLVAAFVALRSGAQVTEQERAMYTNIFSQMGRGYDLNKAVIDGLLTNVMVELNGQYSTALGDDWGDYMTTLDFAPGEVAPVQYETPDRTAVEPTGEDEDFMYTNPEGEQYNVDGEIRLMMEEENINREQIETQLKEWYPDLSDEQIMELLEKHFGGQ